MRDAGVRGPFDALTKQRARYSSSFCPRSPPQRTAAPGGGPNTGTDPRPDMGVLPGVASSSWYVQCRRGGTLDGRIVHRLLTYRHHQGRGSFALLPSLSTSTSASTYTTTSSTGISSLFFSGVIDKDDNDDGGRPHCRPAVVITQLVRSHSTRARAQDPCGQVVTRIGLRPSSSIEIPSHCTRAKQSLFCTVRLSPTVAWLYCFVQLI